ncbi:MAG: Multiple polyol-specific dehydrogenase, partial [uncultured Blastococcus sp.]
DADRDRPPPPEPGTAHPGDPRGDKRQGHRPDRPGQRGGLTHRHPAPDAGHARPARRAADRADLRPQRPDAGRRPLQRGRLPPLPPAPLLRRGGRAPHQRRLGRRRRRPEQPAHEGRPGAPGPPLHGGRAQPRRRARPGGRRDDRLPLRPRGPGRRPGSAHRREDPDGVADHHRQRLPAVPRHRRLRLRRRGHPLGPRRARPPAHRLRLPRRGSRPPASRRAAPVHRRLLRQHAPQRRCGPCRAGRLRAPARRGPGPLDHRPRLLPEQHGRPDHAAHHPRAARGRRPAVRRRRQLAGHHRALLAVGHRGRLLQRPSPAGPRRCAVRPRRRPLRAHEDPAAQRQPLRAGLPGVAGRARQHRPGHGRPAVRRLRRAADGRRGPPVAAATGRHRPRRVPAVAAQEVRQPGDRRPALPAVPPRVDEDAAPPAALPAGSAGHRPAARPADRRRRGLVPVPARGRRRGTGLRDRRPPGRAAPGAGPRRRERPATAARRPVGLRRPRRRPRLRRGARRRPGAAGPGRRPGDRGDRSAPVQDTGPV